MDAKGSHASERKMYQEKITKKTDKIMYLSSLCV
jgi:hypothetical protein